MTNPSATPATPSSAPRPELAEGPPADWLASYAPPGGHYDQFKTPAGDIRPAWTKLAAALRALPAGELARRGDSLRHLIQENGITYNVYGDDENTARLWGMDLLPMILEWAEWQKMEDALRQRVHLLNVILHDLYGPQTLVEQRLLPPQLVLGNPAFLRPCHGFTPPDGIFIHVYAADLARSPDGQWWVLSDRLDAPSGIGYALENRSLTTRVLSDWLRDQRVARLEGFFQTLRTSFEKLVARRTESPRIVLLTPGPANETYFEHSFLARNQGFPLVEGGDLIVRSDRVYLKTLAGLRPVDLILRRVDSDFCDPLEIRSDSLLGVPGLLQSARSGRVALANSLGAGLLESAGLSPFLPALCRHLLGEELKMPSVATWWCGQPRELNYVLEHLDELILQPVFPQPTRPYVVGPRLSAVERERWSERLRAEPAAWCARERVALATTPVIEDARLAPRLFHLRSFLVASGGEYHAMPGGLTRIPAEADLISVSMQRGGLSKDTWVLPPPEKPALFETSIPAPGPVKLRRQTADLPSRVAENLFWLGRYVERADGQARVLRVLAGVLTEEGSATDPAAIRPLFQALLPGQRLPALVSGEPPAFDLAAAERCLRALLWDPKLSCSLAVNSARLEKSAYRVKERLSGDAWNFISRLQRLRRPAPDAALLGGGLHAELADVIVLLSAISGLIMENITRGYGWRFLDLGRRLERGLHVTTLLQYSLIHAGPLPTALLQNLLLSCDSLLTYRRRYLTNLQLIPLLDLLACDDSNPRSLAFQLTALREHVEALPKPPGDEPSNPPERLALTISSQVRLADARLLAEENAQGARPALASFLGPIAGNLAALSVALGQVYFAHAAGASEQVP
jgi:uncharacterized circularly permuted ATP-grasp superfamily protein/uncharacterized alpha-E superfamily protein